MYSDMVPQSADGISNPYDEKSHAWGLPPTSPKPKTPKSLYLPKAAAKGPAISLDPPSGTRDFFPADMRQDRFRRVFGVGDVLDFRALRSKVSGFPVLESKQSSGVSGFGSLGGQKDVVGGIPLRPSSLH